MKKKVIYKYMAWDGEIFDDVKEGLRHDLRAFSHICDDILFFHYGMFDSFDSIPKNEYEDMIEQLRIYHVDTITAFWFHLIGAPVIYCHTEEASKVLNGLINNLANNGFKIKGIKQGFMFFSEEKLDFIGLEELSTEITEAPAFNKLMNTMNTFIKENLS